MHPARWTVFFCLLGLTVLVPAYFVPAMLVANALDGSQWYSVWKGIATFWERGHHFLAAVIFLFSFLFPLAKFALCLLCAGGAGFLPRKFRHGVVAVTEFTAKYSMLDVFVIALFILLVKVEEYVRLLPSLGLYLFSFAILCSAIASGCLRRALHPRGGDDPEMPSAPQAGTVPRKSYLPWLFAGAAVAVSGAVVAVHNSSGGVDAVILTNLTKSPMPRTVEKAMELRDLAKPDVKFWSMGTLKKILNTVQAATTDAGLNKPEAYVILTTRQGQTVSTGRQPIDFGNADLNLKLPLPQTLDRRDIAELKLKTRVEFVGVVPAEIDEEQISVEKNGMLAWTRDWYGRIYQFRLDGPGNPLFLTGAAVLAVGLALFYWAGSGIACGGRRRASRATVAG
jgi:paraquat-inducible protein A